MIIYIGVLILIVAIFAVIGLSVHEAVTRENVDELLTGIPMTNPYRIGAQVVVLESLERQELNWSGVVMSCNGPLITVRDNTYPYRTVQTEREYIFPYGSILDGE